MGTATALKYLYLSYLSRPKGDRLLYRTLGRRGVRKILEIGIGSLSRTQRMLELAGRFSPQQTVRYTAIDLFEARSPGKGGGLSLKHVHRMLKPAGAQVQLIPGDPAPALARWANSLLSVDLVLIGCELDDAALEGAWFYIPRMLHAQSVVLRERVGSGQAVNQFESISAEAIGQRAETGRRRRAA